MTDFERTTDNEAEATAPAVDNTIQPDDFEAWTNLVSGAMRHKWGHGLQDLPAGARLDLRAKFDAGREPQDVVEELTLEDMGLMP